MKEFSSLIFSCSCAPTPTPNIYIYIYLCSGYNPFSQDSRNMLNSVPPAKFSVIETNLLESLSSLLCWVESYYLQDLVPPSPPLKFPWLPPNSLFSLLYFCSILSIVQELYLSHCILVVFTDGWLLRFSVRKFSVSSSEFLWAARRKERSKKIQVFFRKL